MSAPSLLRDALRGVVDPSPRITWVTLRVNADPASDENLTLGDERSASRSPAQNVTGTRELLTTMYESEDGANEFAISEAAWLSEDATAEPNSRIMIAQVLIDSFSGSQKTSLETLQIDGTDPEFAPGQAPYNSSEMNKLGQGVAGARAERARRDTALTALGVRA